MTARPTRAYSRAFPYARTAERRRQINVDGIPPALYQTIRAKAKREGVSLRALILEFLETWSAAADRK